MILLFLFLILIVPYAILTFATHLRPEWSLSRSKRARVGLSLLFAFTALGHFIKTDEMSAMLPSWVSFRTEIIYATGVLELLGAIGIWIPRLRKLTGWCLIVMLLCLLPANIYSAIRKIPFGGHEGGIGYLVIRIPFQLLLIWWTYAATQDKEPVLMSP